MAPKALKQSKLKPTGDPISDFVITVYGKPDLVVEQNLRQLYEKFAACQGEFFLLVQREKDSCLRMATGADAGLMPPHDFTVIKTTLCLGIIRGPLRFGEAGTPIIFPIQTPYVMCEFFGDPWLPKGDIFVPNYLSGYEILMSLKKPRAIANADIDMETPGINMAVGDEEVKELIQQYRSHLNKYDGEYPLLLPFYKMCILLGRYLHHFPEQNQMIDKNPTLFREAHKKLQPTK